MTSPSLPTGIICPQCGQEIRMHAGMAASTLLTIVQAQADRHGVEVQCPQCGHSFLHRRTVACIPRPHRRPSDIPSTTGFDTFPSQAHTLPKSEGPKRTD